MEACGKQHISTAFNILILGKQQHTDSAAGPPPKPHCGETAEYCNVEESFKKTPTP